MSYTDPATLRAIASEHDRRGMVRLLSPTLVAIADRLDFLQRDVHILVQQRDNALAERDAAMALLREAKQYVPNTPSDPYGVILVDRIDALLGGGEAK